jgi:hypothetical protein
MIVRSEDFVPRPPAWEDDPSVSAELKQELWGHGFAEEQSRVECLEIKDECFNCGEKLTTPYVYWQGATANLSLHTKCASQLASGLSQDAFESAKGSPSESGSDATRWREEVADNKQ